MLRGTSLLVVPLIVASGGGLGTAGSGASVERHVVCRLAAALHEGETDEERAFRRWAGLPGEGAFGAVAVELGRRRRPQSR